METKRIRIPERTLTYGSLFSGIGGMDLGLDRAGMRCKWQVEIDPHCRSVLRRHWPDTFKFNDVRTFLDDDTFTNPKYQLENIDVLAGGFPCQDVSNAGENRGIRDDTRSGLWFQYLNAISRLRPGYVLVENVVGLRKRNEDYLGTVLRGLAEIGYDAEWDSIPASVFGAPHSRERIMLIAYPNGKRLLRPSALERRSVPSFFKTSNVYRDACNNVDGWWRENSANIRMGDGIPVSLAKPLVKAFGNAVVPQWAEYAGRLIIDHYRGNVESTRNGTLLL